MLILKSTGRIFWNVLQNCAKLYKPLEITFLTFKKYNLHRSIYILTVGPIEELDPWALLATSYLFYLLRMLKISLDFPENRRAIV